MFLFQNCKFCDTVLNKLYIGIYYIHSWTIWKKLGIHTIFIEFLNANLERIIRRKVALDTRLAYIWRNPSHFDLIPSFYWAKLWLWLTLVNFLSCTGQKKLFWTCMSITQLRYFWLLNFKKFFFHCNFNKIKRKKLLVYG